MQNSDENKIKNQNNALNVGDGQTDAQSDRLIEEVVGESAHEPNQGDETRSINEPAKGVEAIGATDQKSDVVTESEVEPISYAKRGVGYACYKFVKRTFDVFSSGLALIILSPLILILLFIKWVEDFANPVYVSKRVGKNKKDGTRGKEIKFHKIRSMCKNAEKMKQQLIDEGKNEADGPAFKMKDDPRITRFGRFLRKSSLDELLQLWDIFVGRMSVVGPRPPIPSEVDQYTPHQMHRLDVKGGLLCLWQIQKNRNSLTFEEWTDLDIEYIKNQSVWLDLKIIFKGLFMVLFDRSGE